VYVITDKDGKTPTLTGDPNFSRKLSVDDMQVTFVSICEKEKKPVEDIPEEKPAIEFIADGWATSELEIAYNNDFLASSLIGTDLTEEITRAEFAETAVLVYEKITGEKTNAASSPFNDISHLSSHMKEMVEKSYALGFINGVDEYSFAPDMLLTREQAATILYRIYEKLGKGYEVSANPFYDDEEISSWAKIPVYFMVNNGILQGMGDNLFMPKANAQKQQAVAIAVRIFENLR